MAARTVVPFYSTAKDELRWLSNLAPTRILYDGCYYPTGEHAFQYAKFLLLSDLHTETSKRRRVLLRYACRFIMGAKGGYGASGGAASEAGESMPLKAEEKAFLGSPHALAHMENAQRDILRQKAQLKEVQDALATLKKGTMLLYFVARSTREHPDYWGGRLDEDTGEIIGKNTLGRMWEEHFSDSVLAAGRMWEPLFWQCARVRRRMRPVIVAPRLYVRVPFMRAVFCGVCIKKNGLHRSSALSCKSRLTSSRSASGAASSKNFWSLPRSWMITSPLITTMYWL